MRPVAGSLELELGLWSSAELWWTTFILLSTLLPLSLNTLFEILHGVVTWRHKANMAAPELHVVSAANTVSVSTGILCLRFLLLPQQ